MTKFLILLLLCISCSTSYKNQQPLNKAFPLVRGISLSKQKWVIPKMFDKKPTILLIGYVQNSQFDIDRWLIGLDMKGVKTATYEVPTIAGMLPKMFSTKINDGMRKGIPKELWKGVITIYEDGEIIQKFTGNERPNNTRVILLDSKGVVRFFSDKGFSVPSLNRLIKTAQSL